MCSRMNRRGKTILFAGGGAAFSCWPRAGGHQFGLFVQWFIDVRLLLGDVGSELLAERLLFHVRWLIATSPDRP